MGSLLFFAFSWWGILLQAFAIIHFIRRRPNTFWLWIILIGGWLGALVYIAVEAIPDAGLLRQSFKVFPRRKRIRELESAAKAAAGTQPDLLAYQEARALWNTDPVAALGKAFKGDPGELAERFMKFYFAGGDAIPSKTETDAAVVASDNPLAAEVKELKAWKDAREKAEKDAGEATARAAVQKAQDEQIDGWMAALEPHAHPLVRRPENRRDAVNYANAAVIELAKQQGIPMETNDPQINAGLFKEGFALAEQQLREEGKRFMFDTSATPPATGAPPEQPKASPAQIPARTTTKPAATIVPSPAVMTVDQARRKATEDLTAMLSQGRLRR